LGLFLVFYSIAIYFGTNLFMQFSLRKRKGSLEVFLNIIFQKFAAMHRADHRQADVEKDWDKTC